MQKYVEVPDSWKSKNYAFEFLEIINSVVEHDIFKEIEAANFHTLTIDESTDTYKC